MKKLLYSAYYPDNGHPFDALVHHVHTKAISNPDDLIEKDSLLVIWGGSDINPSLYAHSPCSETYPGGKRDFVEWELAKRAVQLGIPIIGVCRGAQMLCALAGGYLIQHTTHHVGRHHNVETYDGQEIRTNSIHHQMMVVPEGVDHKVLAWCNPPSNPTYKFDGNKTHPDVLKELEFVYFPKIKGYAIQWHPEMMSSESEATRFVMKEIEKNGY